MPSDGSGGTVTRDPVDGPYVHAEDVTLTAKAEDGYAFLGWSGRPAGLDSTSVMTVRMDQDRSLTAHFKPRNSATAPIYDLRLVLGTGGGGTLKGVGQGTLKLVTTPTSGGRTVQCGQSISYSATAGTGYCFSRWGSATLGASGQSSCQTTSGVQSIASFAADFTFTAHFTKKRYTLRITKTTGGSVSPGAGTHTYSHGTRVTITATPLYRFRARWSGACSGSGSTCTVTMNGPRSVSVTFSPVGSGGFGEEEATTTPSPTATPSPSATATPSPSATPSPTATPSSTATATPSPRRSAPAPT